MYLFDFVFSYSSISTQTSNLIYDLFPEGYFVIFLFLLITTVL